MEAFGGLKNAFGRLKIAFHSHLNSFLHRKRFPSRFLDEFLQISWSPNLDFCNTLQGFSWFSPIQANRFQDASQVPFELQKSPKMAPKYSQEPPKTLPRRLQELPRSLQECPRSLQEAQKDSQEAAYSSQDAAKRLQEAPKRLQEAPKRDFWSLQEGF